MTTESDETTITVETTENVPFEKSDQIEEKLKNMEVHLYKGEKIELRDNSVFEFDGKSWNQGAFITTNYRVLYYSGKFDKAPTPISLPLCSMHKLEKIGGKTTSKDMAYAVEISMKDGRVLKFSFLPKKNTRGKIVKSIKKELTTKDFFAFSYEYPLNNDSINGWKIFDEQSEFDRQGALEFGMWRISDVNVKFAISETYPKYFCVPKSVSDSDIKAAAHFRSKGRLPVLTWFDKNSGASLTRASQPLIGINIQNKKNKEDLELIQSILKTNTNPKLIILDLRPRANAEANKMFKGAGYEKNYDDCEIRFMGIHNIHVMRGSFFKVMELCQSGGYDQQWLSKLESTSWLDHIKLLLNSSLYVTETLENEKMNILAHCSDGWDRTAQVCALSQIMLDPYFRTLEGFAVLIEKDWLSFGHKFQDRLGHGFRNFNSDERGPIFIQFLETLYQLLFQYPTYFEYSEELLLFVADEMYSCRFGTFLCDRLKERLNLELPKKTVSIWSYILNNKKKFYNPYYDSLTSKYTIVPDVRTSSIHLWTGYWLRDSHDQKGQKLYLPNPDKLMNKKGMELYSKSLEYEEIKKVESNRNEETVLTFQTEVKELRNELVSLVKSEKEWKEKWQNDTKALLSLCENQKNELQKLNSIIMNKDENTINIEKEIDDLNKQFLSVQDIKINRRIQNKIIDSDELLLNYKTEIEELKNKIKILENQDENGP
eukprot:gene5143-8749_t